MFVLIFTQLTNVYKCVLCDPIMYLQYYVSTNDK